MKNHCSIDECINSATHRGWCKPHYMRWRRHGDPLSGAVPRGASEGSPKQFLEETVMHHEGDGCLLWPFAKYESGYPQITIDGVHRSLTRLICTRVNGDAPTPEHHAAHSCGNGHLGCVTKRHLSWKTRSENEADKLAHGTHNRGERHNMAKLTEADVRQIRALKGTASQREIAARFGIKQSTVSDVQSRKVWKHVA